MTKIFYIIILLFLTPIYAVSQSALYYFPDLIDASKFTFKKEDSANIYSARGTWFGFSVPNSSDTINYGKFGGPYCYKSEQWLSNSIFNFNFKFRGTDMELKNANLIKSQQLPGLLYQVYEFDLFKIELKLTYISKRTVLYQATAINTGTIPIQMIMSINGEMFEGIGQGEAFNDGWKYNCYRSEEIVWLLRFSPNQNDITDALFSSTGYLYSHKDYQTISSKDSLKMTVVISQYFIGDPDEDIKMATDVLNEPDKYVDRTEGLWDFIISSMEINDGHLKRLSIKAILELYNNMRSNLPDFENFGFISSKTQTYSNTDESWLIASSLVKYDSKLSLYQILTSLNSINEIGTLDKFVSLTEPDNLKFKGQSAEKPMAAWAVWNLYLVKPKIELLEFLYPILKKHHQYWYTLRDKNKNNWCEDINGNESVILNALLFSDKHHLRLMANVLELHQDVNDYTQQINAINQSFNQHFFNLDLMTYVDKDIEKNKDTVNPYAIAYCMWSGLASLDIAKICLPNIERDIVLFDDMDSSLKYNLEYQYFLISGLKLYQFTQLSETLRSKILELHLKNYQINPIKNYNPENDEFIEHSSLAAAILLLLINY
jgi:putative isomerase